MNGNIFQSIFCFIMANYTLQNLWNGVWIKMSQKIYCSVGSCSYNATDKNECTLKSIQVTPCPNCKKGNPEDESFCGSYCKCK